MTGAAAATLGGTCVLAATVGREEGERLARDELSRRIYGGSQPSLYEIISSRVLDWLERMTSQVESAVPGGWWVLGPLLAVLVVVAVLLVVHLRPARSARRRAAVDTGAPAPPADHRAAAEESAATCDYGAAVRERLRAILRDLEERAIIAPRPGRTATELAAEVSAELPQRRAELERAAEAFNGIVYGTRTATAETYQLLCDLDDQLGRTRPAQHAGHAG